ncbi:hypothetical protein BGW42_002336 [Actinomortierella wolfii]|nr:hypothetical protein BGW42_002336 [Actinomortierella wolfii]
MLGQRQAMLAMPLLVTKPATRRAPPLALVLTRLFRQPQSTSTGSSSPSSSSPSSAPSPSSTKSQAPHDTVSSSGSGSSSSSAQAKFGTSATAGPSTTEDKDDDAWAINESYSGHSASGGSSSSRDGTRTDNANRMTSHSEGDSDRRHASSPMASQDNVQEGHKHHNDDDDRHSTLRPSLSSFKDAASIEKSWRRTSDQLTPNSTSASSTSSKSSSSGSTISRPGGQSQAGNLDLSSSTLVQQMLFRDRRSQTSDDDDAATKKKEDDHSSASVAAAQGKDEHIHFAKPSSSPFQDALFSRDRRQDEWSEDEAETRNKYDGDNDEDDQFEQRLKARQGHA